ncbi:DinB family protein [Zunongwangia sp. F363]|uniref:DinB family protein n=1 Tax=Autumnicola tepida TaxID=3075595 RepID=A0ABU3CAZ3_9FLAO|nr:DinB family protein [Zunongwangia sp. F363]MDT0643210.1 DinB family protein [Zunongwangia sp. F363]
MKIQEFLIPELQYEVTITEKFIKRLPEDKMDWRPHQKSMTLGELANHLAEIPSWITATMEMDEMDLEGFKSSSFKKVPKIIEALKLNTTQAEIALRKPDTEYEKTWKIIKGGKVVLEMPKFNVLRTVVMNQLPHHRAQLGVYFRLLDIPVPSTYGPSADEV